MWKDCETNIDLLDFDYLVDVVEKIAKDKTLSPSTIGIYGDWGSGKSSLMNMVYDRLSYEDKKSNIHCVKFNGWLFEGYEDAKTALLGTILDEIEKKKRLPVKAKEHIKNLFKSLDYFKLASKGIKHGMDFLLTGGIGTIAGLSVEAITNAIKTKSHDITEDEIKGFEQIYIVACGSAWHVGMAAQYVLEDMADISVRVELASEFRYRKMPLNQKALVIVVSQSGETADTLAALRMAKEKGITTMAIVNVVGSSIAREADKVFYTLAGPEISVATTKAYSAQLAAMYCLSVQFAKVREKITEEQYSYYISELLTLPEKMQKTLEDKERIQWFAAKYANAHDVFFVGRGIDYAVCLEGSLKLKEISYIHSEAYAAGELKHGTISLIERGTLVIGVLTQSKLYEKTISNMLECKSRGAYLMGLTTYGKYEIEDQVNFTVYVPKVDEHFVGSLAVIPLQLLGYYVSVAKGLDVDKPRNLAKSVTVE